MRTPAEEPLCEPAGRSSRKTASPVSDAGRTLIATDRSTYLYCGSGAVGASDFENYAAFMRYAFRSSLEARYTVANLGFRGVLASPEADR